MVRPWLLVVLVIVILTGIGFFGWNYLQGKKTVSQPVVTDNSIIATPTSDTAIVASSTPSKIVTPAPAQASTNTANYSDTTNGYSFDYLKTWTVTPMTPNGNAVGAVSPETKASGNTPVDVIISRNDYTSMSVSNTPGLKVSGGESLNNTPHDQQAKSSAQDLSSVVTPIQLAGKSGYLAISGGNILNFVLIGDNDMIMVQFMNASSVDKLSAGQKVIYDSLKITK